MTHTFKTIRDAVEAGKATSVHEDAFAEIEILTKRLLGVKSLVTVFRHDPDWQALGLDWRTNARFMYLKRIIDRKKPKHDAHLQNHP